MDLYICPRCGYCTPKKPRIFDHLYKRKKTCPYKSNDIELTNEIKQSVLDNHVYKIKGKNKINNGTINKIINNIDNIDNITNNNINIFLNLDPIQKMNHHHKAINNTLLPIGDIISMLYENDIIELDDGIGNHLYSHEHLIETVNNVTQLRDKHKFTDCILIHEKDKQNTLCFNDKQTILPAWESIDNDKSGRNIVEIIQAHVWNNYEFYLIRKLEKNNNVDNEDIKRHLYLYYKFISCFDLNPHVCDAANDNEILYNIDDTEFNDNNLDSIKRKYIKLYHDCKTNLDEMARIAIRMLVDYIVKNNGSYSYENFNDKIKTIFVRDPKYMSEMNTIVI